MNGYPGSKAASGVVQRILSLMPRHDRYIEPFLGGGFVLDRKRPALCSIVADADADVINYHRKFPQPNTEYRIANFDDFLGSLTLTSADLVYMDPPYVLSTRSKKKIYPFEMTDDDHRRLLSLALTLKASVMISGYRCSLYDEMLAGWHREDFRAMTRGGVRIESVWCNFKPGASFHDTRFLGGNFRERERIKRKKIRWTSRFLAMSAAERAVIYEALELAASGAPSL